MRKTILGSALAVLASNQAPCHAGDVAAGEAAFKSRGCIGCHGISGKTPIAPSFPVVGGKPEGFIAGELTRFRSGDRRDPAMNAMAAALGDADIANIAAYLSAQ